MNRTQIVEAFRGEAEQVVLKNGSLAYWRFGSGPDVVFVHGWPLHGATWRNVVAEMTDRFTCHVFDLPGTGQSQWPVEAPFGLWEHADTVSEALDVLGLESVAMVGHDSGATITRLIDSLMPGRVWAHVMGNTEIPGHVPAALRRAKYAKFVPGLHHLAKAVGRSGRAMRATYGSCFDDLSMLEGEFGEFFVAPMGRDLDYVRGQLRLVHELDVGVVERELAGVHSEIVAPVMLIWGKRDPWFPWRRAESMVESFAGPPADVHLYERGKLFVHEEYASDFGTRAAQFLENAKN